VNWETAEETLEETAGKRWEAAEELQEEVAWTVSEIEKAHASFRNVQEVSGSHGRWTEP
jgi:hypothetical protein